MKALTLLFMLSTACPLLAQTVKIKFVVLSEITTEMTSTTDIHVITKDGPYNFNEIRSMTFWGDAPDSATIDHLRNNGIGIYLKSKYLKPNSEKSSKAFEMKVRERSDTTLRKDTIRMERNRYWKGSVKMSERDILSILESNPASHAEAARARANMNGAQVVGFVSGILIGYPIGQAIGGKQEPQWGLAASGAAFLLIGGISFSNGYKRHVKNAIELYNASPRSARATSIRLVPSLNGATLYVRF